MQQLFYFFQKNKYFLFFLFLEVIAVALIINNHSFHRSKFISSTNYITGSIYEQTSGLSEYLNLKEKNLNLSKENTLLKNKLDKLYSIIDNVNVTVIIDSLNYNQNYKYINGKIISNNYSSSDNFITINRGIKNGVSNEMAVINNKGVIGITDNTGNKYARVQSILNANSKINASFKNSNHFGTLIWNGEKYNIVQLTDIPRQATFKIGDTIITGGRSTIFPKGIPIGTVSKMPKKLSATNTIDVKLFNDMSNLGHIYIITNLNKNEIKSLENKNE